MVIDHVISGYRQFGPNRSHSLVLHILTTDILLESSTIKIDRIFSSQNVKTCLLSKKREITYIWP